MAALVFEPELHWAGSTEFKWKGKAGSVYSRNEAKVLILVINRPPIINDSQITGKEDQILWLNKTYFSRNFKDIDNDQIVKIKITELPIHGTLKLSGSPIYINQEIEFLTLQDF